MHVIRNRWFGAISLGAIAVLITWFYLHLFQKLPSDFFAQPMLTIGVLAAFFGAALPTFLFAKSTVVRKRDLFLVFMLGDIVAAAVFAVGSEIAIAAGLLGHPLRQFDTFLFIQTIVAVFGASLIVGNYITRGVGFIMMVPALIWLIARNR